MKKRRLLSNLTRWISRKMFKAESPSEFFIALGEYIVGKKSKAEIAGEFPRLLEEYVPFIRYSLCSQVI